MFVFVDESGSTNIKAGQEYFVLSFCLSNNKAYCQELIETIRERCRKEGKPILNKKEVKYHELSRFQQEIALEILNKYRNYYAAFIDIKQADSTMTSGKDEDYIQRTMMELVAIQFKDKIREKGELAIYVDKKLSVEAIAGIKKHVHGLRGSNKGIRIEWKNSKAFHGLQVADLIAGAFRAKLMKRSGLLDVPKNNMFECIFKEKKLILRKYFV